MADTPNQEGFKFTWDWLDPLGEGFLWSVLTVALAIFVTFFIDFFVILISNKGLVGLADVTALSFKADRIFSISMVLLSALIIEQWFTHFETPKIDTALIFAQILILVGILVVSTVHYFHETEPEEYKAEFQRGYELYIQSLDNHNQIDSSQRANRQHLVWKQEEIDTATVAYWHDISVILKTNGRKIQCSCRNYAIFALISVFIASVIIRTRMLIRRLKNDVKKE